MLTIPPRITREWAMSNPEVCIIYNNAQQPCDAEGNRPINPLRGLSNCVELRTDQNMASIHTALMRIRLAMQNKFDSIVLCPTVLAACGSLVADQIERTCAGFCEPTLIDATNL